MKEKCGNSVLNCIVAWIPAFAGMTGRRRHWIPAFAGMTAPFSSVIVIPAKAGIQPILNLKNNLIKG
ncbi:MAG: hypothetical protein PHY80_00505 [Rickettsiales bacterium]|nr:hypothetical protein [Rickettsiales bacterium]